MTTSFDVCGRVVVLNENAVIRWVLSRFDSMVGGLQEISASAICCKGQPFLDITLIL
jgi:hypothetical protein